MQHDIFVKLLPIAVWKSLKIRLELGLKTQMFLSFTGIIHGDLNDQNIIVTPVGNGNHEVSGILDFSLLTNGCYVFEVAIEIMYLMLENCSPLDVGGVVLAGWESIMVLNEDERDSLFLLVPGRFCQSLVYGRYNVKKIPRQQEISPDYSQKWDVAS